MVDNKRVLYNNVLIYLNSFLSKLIEDGFKDDKITFDLSKGGLTLTSNNDEDPQTFMAKPVFKKKTGWFSKKELLEIQVTITSNGENQNQVSRLHVGLFNQEDEEILQLNQKVINFAAKCGITLTN